MIRRSLLFFLAVACQSLYGQYSFDDFTDPRGTNGGTTVATFLTLPVSGQQLSSGLVANLAAMNATDIAFSPANTALLTRNTFAASHLEWIMGLRKEYSGACFPLRDIGTVGAYMQVFTLGRFENARDINEFPSNPRSLEASTGISFSRSFLQRRLSAGITASYIESHLAGDDGRAVAATIDGLAQPLPWLTGRMYVRNLGTPLRYNDASEPLPLQSGLALSFTPPLSPDSLGYSRFNLTAGLGVQKTIDRPLQIGAGLDFNLLSHLSLRCGYEYTYGQSASVAGLAAGFGLDINGVGVDGGWKYQSAEFGSVWSVTARFASPEITPLTAMDYYRMAEEYFEKQRYRRCIVNLRRALALNPTLWQAHSLMTRTLSAMRREKGVEIALIYSANTLGQFIPRAIDETSLGGLARQATAIRSLRAEYPISFTIDGGSMITGGSDLIRARFADLFYSRIGYDAVGLGEGELQFGFQRYCEKAKKSGMKFVCSNWTDEGDKNIVRSRIISRGRYTCAVLNAVPASLAAGKAPLGDLVRSIAELLDTPDIQRCNLRVAILHGPWESVSAAARQLPGLDVILCASLDQPFQSPMQIGSTLLISTGSQGRYVGALSLRFDKAGGRIGADNRLIQLSDRISPDPEIEREAVRISTTVEGQQPPPDHHGIAQSLSLGVFPFVSTRTGTPEIYLKIIKRHIEFPISGSRLSASQPRLSREPGGILYLERGDSTGRTVLKIADLTGANSRVLPLPGAVTEACFSADERWIYAAVQGGRDSTCDIYRIRAAGGEALPVVVWPGSREASIRPTPDGRSILFTSTRDGSRQIYMTDTAGQTPVRISRTDNNHSSPAIDSSGRYLAYLTDRYGTGGRQCLMVQDLHTGTAVRLTRNTDVRAFTWLPGGQSILYSAGVNLYDFNVRNIFKKGSTKLIPAKNKKDYSETSPQLIRVGADYRLIYVREYGDGERVICMVGLDGTRDQCIVNSDGVDWLE